jgi:chorismate dehydratase
MIFGKIDYINLLPFTMFIKRSSLPSRIKQMMDHNQSYPAKINAKFKRRVVDAAFISSVESKRGNIQRLDLGIIAKKHVTSVLLCGDTPKLDPHSATSNQLAKVLGLQGEVVIGDRALQRYLKDPHECIDLAQKWFDKHSLPFVFARLCTNKHHEKFQILAKKFSQNPIKIPQYILKKYAAQRDIPPKEILKYLKLLEYKMGKKEKLSLKIFLKSLP